MQEQVCLDEAAPAGVLAEPAFPVPIAGDGSLSLLQAEFWAAGWVRGYWVLF